MLISAHTVRIEEQKFCRLPCMPCLKQAYVANLESYVTDIWKVRPLSHFLLVADETNTIYSGLILKVALREKQKLYL